MTRAGFTEYLSSSPSRVRTKVVSPPPLQSQASQDSQHSRDFFAQLVSRVELKMDKKAAQASLPYNRHYLLTHAQYLPVERLPAICVDNAFFEYFASRRCCNCSRSRSSTGSQAIDVSQHTHETNQIAVRSVSWTLR